jgi:hypothetical protein
MKTWKWLLLLVAAGLMGSSAAWAQGDFYVIAGGGPPVGTKITSLPYTISNPGFYYLTGNLTYTGTGNGITVASDDVTIDLMGFRIIGPGSNGNSFGITLYDGTNNHNNVEVRNGTLSGWQYGINSVTNQSIRNRALNLRVENCSYGIFLVNSVVKGCIVEASTTGIDIFGGVASGNLISNCGFGINGHGTVIHNSIYSCSEGISCQNASSIIGNTIVATTGTTYGINIATTAPVLVTQNAVSVTGTPFIGGAGTVNISNAGF